MPHEPDSLDEFEEEFDDEKAAPRDEAKTEAAGKSNELSTRSLPVGHELLFINDCDRLLTCSKILIT